MVSTTKALSPYTDKGIDVIVSFERYVRAILLVLAMSFKIMYDLITGVIMRVFPVMINKTMVTRRQTP
jgi:hypothetical protein